MSSLDNLTTAFDGLKQSVESGRMSHAYLIVGSPRGNALALAESLLQLVFCGSEKRPCGACAECARVKERRHPDILWIEPESKSRKIDIERIREELAPRITQTSFSGGWKAGVLFHADRLTEGAANAFLKLLEEPPGSSLLLLLTDTPQFLLPTIVSRCQRIILSTEPEKKAGVWYEPLMNVLREGDPGRPLEAIIYSAQLEAILSAVEKAVSREEDQNPAGGDEDDEVGEARLRARFLAERTNMMRCMLNWHRDVLFCTLDTGGEYLHFPEESLVLKRQAGQLTYAAALSRLRMVEEMVRQMERNLPQQAVFETALFNQFRSVQPMGLSAKAAIW